MSRHTAADVLVLHALRTLGYADTARIAVRLGLAEDEVREHLLDAQAHGWAAHSSYAGEGGWSLTEAGARAVVEEVYQAFLPLNEVVAAACTGWQLTEMGIGEQTMTLAETIATLQGPANALARVEERLTAQLHRFAGYHHRFTTALTKAGDEPAWITGTDRDSCHRVWFELHEDLIATLGLVR
jgi:hypothetical protein